MFNKLLFVNQDSDMDVLSDIQLRKMSVEELDSLMDSLYNKYDNLKSTISENVWTGDHGGVSSSLGIAATREIEDVKLFISRVEKALSTKNIEPLTSAGAQTNNLPQQTKEFYFSTYAEAKEWSKSNIGKAFTRSADGSGFVPIKK